MVQDDLAACRRMRACLLGIADLDPEGVRRRLDEIDREIAHLEALLGTDQAKVDASGRPGQIEVIRIGASGVKAA